MRPRKRSQAAGKKLESELNQKFKPSETCSPRNAKEVKGNLSENSPPIVQILATKCRSLIEGAGITRLEVPRIRAAPQLSRRPPPSPRAPADSPVLALSRRRPSERSGRLGALPRLRTSLARGEALQGRGEGQRVRVT